MQGEHARAERAYLPQAEEVEMSEMQARAHAKTEVTSPVALKDRSLTQLSRRITQELSIGGDKGNVPERSAQKMGIEKDFSLNV